MKKSKYPRFRSITRRGKSGQIWLYYRYDMRHVGKADIQLGKNYEAALLLWEKLHNQLPLSVGTVQEAIDRFRERELLKYSNPQTRRSYEKQLKNVERVFGKATWHEVTLPTLRLYLDKRTAKVQGNRELAILSIVWSKARLWGLTNMPWPASGVKGWKNEERPRQIEVTDAIFDAIYASADRVLQDSMDISTATGLRVTDVRTLRLPVNGALRFKSSKTAQSAEFQVADSAVLSALVNRRLAMKVHSVMLLITDSGRPVSERMLSERWDDARSKAAKNSPELAIQLLSMYNRDMRKRAADLADDLETASRLLQHSSTKLTAAHYRTKVQKLKAVR